MAEDLSRNKWYDMSDLSEFHNDLRANWRWAVSAASKRPMLRKHMTDCAECAEIRAAYEAAVAPVLKVQRRRMEVIISTAEMAKILNLESAANIIHMYTVHNPNFIHVLIESPELEPVDEGAAAPAVQVSATDEMAA